MMRTSFLILKTLRKVSKRKWGMPNDHVTKLLAPYSSEVVKYKPKSLFWNSNILFKHPPTSITCHYSRGGNSGNACFVSLCGICARILIFRVLHVIPHVSWCQNFCNFKNPSPTANIITILVKTTISEMYHFFLQFFLQSFAMTRTTPLPTRVKILVFFTSAGPVAWWPSTLGSPSHVCGIWNFGPGEMGKQLPWMTRRGSGGGKYWNNYFKEIFEEDDKQGSFSFWINVINVRNRQLI